MSDFRTDAAARLAPFDLPAADEPRIVEELALHLEARYAELRRDGHDDATARRQVLDEISDDALRQGGWLSLPIRAAAAPAPMAPASGPFDALARDLRYAMRSLWRQPSFTIAAVLALALGIGGTTAVLGTLDAVLLRPMPFPHADRLFVPVGQNLFEGLPARDGVLRRRGRLASRGRTVRRGVPLPIRRCRSHRASAIPNASGLRSSISVLPRRRRRPAGWAHACRRRSPAGRAGRGRDQPRALAAPVRRRGGRRRSNA